MEFKKYKIDSNLQTGYLKEAFSSWKKLLESIKAVAK